MSDEPISITEQLNTLYRQVAVLRAEVKAWREWQRTKCDDNASSLDHWHACKALDAATLETDRTHALDAAKIAADAYTIADAMLAARKEAK